MICCHRRPIALVLLALTGCEGLRQRHGLPDSPLFILRKPLEAHAVSAPPVAVTHVEPVPPTNPYFAASAPRITSNRPAPE